MNQTLRRLGRRASNVVCIAGVVVGAAAAPSSAQIGDTVVSRELAPGVAYRQFVDTRGPLVAYLVRVDLRRSDLELREVRADDRLRGRQKPTDMVRRVASDGVAVLAAVNGDFFDLKTGENENDQVIGGEWWKGLKVTDSPYDTYDNVHTQLAFDSARRPFMDRFVLDGKAWVTGRGPATPIINVNHDPSGNPEGTALFTSRFGPATPRDTSRQTAEAPLIAAGRRGDTLLYVRRGAVSAQSGSPIPGNGAVLSAYGIGLRLQEVQAMRDGDTINVLLTTLPRLARGAAPALVIGGWPRILRDGVNVASEAATVEGTISRNAEMKHPRTAVGISRDSATLFILAIDGRSQRSVGVTLVGLASMMRQLGAWQAMNFDGGGSTTMVIDGALVNVPSDSAGERAVGNALMVVRRR
ncbi:MAG TPA: phosphodiester glycosidase family protein [Gemmatimonadaceae bacterium]